MKQVFAGAVSAAAAKTPPGNENPAAAPVGRDGKD
jgi:hypothetical protein